jgi:hypothetical protein
VGQSLDDGQGRRGAGRWRDGTAELAPLDPQMLARFRRYARLGPATLGIDSMLVRVELDSGQA